MRTNTSALLRNLDPALAAGLDDDDLDDLLDDLEEAEEEEEEPGEEDDDDDVDDDDEGGDDGRRGRSGGDDRTSRIVTRETRKARNKARKELLAELGFDTVDAAKTFTDEARRRQQENESEAERRQREADERERRAEARERAAAEKAVRADVRAALLDAGVNRERLDRATRNVLADLGDDLTDLDDDAVAEAVETLVGDSPEWFTVGDNDDDARRRTAAAASSARHGRRDRGRQAGKSGFDRGEDMAREWLEQQQARFSTP